MASPSGDESVKGNGTLENLGEDLDDKKLNNESVDDIGRGSEQARPSEPDDPPLVIFAKSKGAQSPSPYIRMNCGFIQHAKFFHTSDLERFKKAHDEGKLIKHFTDTILEKKLGNVLDNDIKNDIIVVPTIDEETYNLVHASLLKRQTNLTRTSSDSDLIKRFRDKKTPRPFPLRDSSEEEYRKKLQRFYQQEETIAKMQKKLKDMQDEAERLNKVIDERTETLNVKQNALNMLKQEVGRSASSESNPAKQPKLSETFHKE